MTELLPLYIFGGTLLLGACSIPVILLKMAWDEKHIS